MVTWVEKLAKGIRTYVCCPATAGMILHDRAKRNDVCRVHYRRFVIALYLYAAYHKRFQ
jgi:hypothetical protein